MAGRARRTTGASIDLASGVELARKPLGWGGRRGRKLVKPDETRLAFSRQTDDRDAQRTSSRLGLPADQRRAAARSAPAASSAAVARVLHEAGYEMEERLTRPPPDKQRSFERAKPNQFCQTDLFTFVLKRQNRRLHLVAFMDDHSRFLVSYGLHASANPSFTCLYEAPNCIDNGPDIAGIRHGNQLQRTFTRF